MPRWIEDDDERMRQVESKTDTNCVHGVELEDACYWCLQAVDDEGTDNDDAQLSAAIDARKHGNLTPMQKYREELKKKRR